MIPCRSNDTEPLMAEEGNAGEATPRPAGAERRAAARHSSTLSITCYPIGGGLTERRRARVRNVSRTGVGLVVDRAWERGVALGLELPGAEGVRVVRAHVTHATPQLGGCFLVGCTLD